MSARRWIGRELPFGLIVLGILLEGIGFAIRTGLIGEHDGSSATGLDATLEMLRRSNDFVLAGALCLLAAAILMLRFHPRFGWHAVPRHRRRWILWSAVPILLFGGVLLLWAGARVFAAARILDVQAASTVVLAATIGVIGAGLLAGATWLVYRGAKSPSARPPSGRESGSRPPDRSA